MSQLKSEPPAPVRTLDELLAIAHAMEHEAAERYAEFAIRARRDGMADLAPLFEQLAEDERQHEHSVRDWSLRLRGKVPDPAEVRWELPETFDVAAGVALAGSHVATAYRILSVAVLNEERAFALWSYIAAHADSPDIRQAAEKMARQELQHAWLLRRARRQAYHAQEQNQDRAVNGKSFSMLGSAEASFAKRLDAGAVRTTGDTSRQLHDLALQSQQLAVRLGHGKSTPSITNDDWDDLLATAEQLVEDYLTIGDRAADEAVIAEAQTIAEQAVLRLAQLRALGDALPGRPRT